MLTLPQIQTAPEDRVATAVVSAMFGPVATKLMAAAIMISTFGCCNGMIMSGARVYFTMARDNLFFRRAGTLDPAHHTPVFALVIQCVWTILLTLSGQYDDLLDYVIFAVLLFYILTIGGLFRLRRTRPELPRPYRAAGYPVLPALYMLVATVIEILLLVNKPAFTVRGLIIVLLGVPGLFPLARQDGAIPLSLFATKPIARILRESEGGEHQLKRTLGPVNLVALGIGAIIGAGLFAITPLAAHDNAGPAVVFSFLIAAIGCAFAGMCYSEFATMIPIAGSAYTYAYATMGELLAWIIGWDLVLEYAVGAATVSVSWSSYLVRLLGHFGITLPASLTASPFDQMAGGHGSSTFPPSSSSGPSRSC